MYTQRNPGKPLYLSDVRGRSGLDLTQALRERKSEALPLDLNISCM